MAVSEIWLSARYGCTKEESKIMRCHQDWDPSVTAVSEIWLSARYGCQRDKTGLEIWLLARVRMSKKLCIAAKTCLLLLTTKTVTAIWPLAIYYQRYITVSKIWVYSYWYNLAVIASCASGGPSWSCVNCRCNCASVCVLDTIPHFLSIQRKNTSVYVLNASVLLGVS